MSSAAPPKTESAFLYHKGTAADTPKSLTIDQAEEEEGQPGKQADKDDPPVQKFESRGGKP